MSNKEFEDIIGDMEIEEPKDDIVFRSFLTYSVEEIVAYEAARRSAIAGDYADLILFIMAVAPATKEYKAMARKMFLPELLEKFAYHIKSENGV